MRNPEYVSTAAGNGNTEILKMLLDREADPNPGMPVAIQKNNTAIFRMLLAEKASVNRPEFVSSATTNGNLEILTACLSGGAPAQSGLPIAVKKNSPEMTGLLLQYQANPNANGIMATAAASAGPQVIGLLLDANGDPNAGTEAAVKRGDAPIVRQFLERGADFTRADFIAYASQENNLEVVKVLLEGRANPTDGILHAVSHNHTAVAALLLNSGADFSDEKVVAFPAKYGNTQLLRLLLDKGADPNHGSYFQGESQASGRPACPGESPAGKSRQRSYSEQFPLCRQSPD